MSYYIWIMINAITVITTTIYIWIIQPQPSVTIRLGQLVAQIAIILFIVNINMYFILLVIRKAKTQKLRVSLAKIARKMMKYHIIMALFATSLIVIHAIIMLIALATKIGFFHLKMISGYMAIIALCVTLIGGYRRHKKASGFRRRFHYMTAFCFAAFFIIHIFIPL